MKKVYLILAATVGMTLASCTTNDYVGEEANIATVDDGSIRFVYDLQNMTRAGELTGATAAEKLGGMFVVEGTKGSEQTNSPSTTVVFDNYLVGYEYNSAGRTKDNTNNWEYVGLQSGITDRMTPATWTNLHTGTGTAKSQEIKYWDNSTTQYDFIAWSTGTREAVTTTPTEGSSVQVTRISTGETLKTNGFKMTALSANDLFQCYYTDINTVLKADYGKPVTLTFKNMAAKVRVALYETVPGYSVKDVKFYSNDANPTAPGDLGTGSSAVNAVLFTMGEDKLPQSGDVLVYYPHIGTTHRDASPQTKDYNKASVTVTAGTTTTTTQTYGALTDNYTGKEKEEADGKYLGRSVTGATYAGKAADAFYTPAFPNTNGKPLTLRVDFTLVSTDGSGEEINVYGAKAVVPATYTVWQPNYAYTYIFKISDNSNGWTSTTSTDPQGLFPITFDAVVANFTDANAEQATITTVATPSITTYQQGHDHKNKDEYSKSQKAGANTTDVKDLYVQVMDNSGATSTLKGDLKGSKKSRLYKIEKGGGDYVASEAEVLDALQNRTNVYTYASAIGRNGITLAYNSNIDNTVTSIINGVDDQPITKIAGEDIVAGQVAKIDIDQLDLGTYAYVYSETVPSADEVVYNVVSPTVAATSYSNYYEIDPSVLSATSDPTAVAKKVYFVANRDAQNNIVSYTFVQTKVGVTSVAGFYEATIDLDSAAKATSYTAGNFYFDVYYQNNGAYAVKVIKVVN